MSQNHHQVPAKPSRPVVVLTGGGSGGHITPLLSLAHALKRLDKNCLLAYVSLKGEKLSDFEPGYKIFDNVFKVSSGKLRRYHGQGLLRHLIDVKALILNARDFFRVLAGTASALNIIKKTGADVVFSKGGYAAVPVGIAARLRGIPIITHDSDAVPGLANRILGRWAVIRTFGVPSGNQRAGRAKIYYTGIPLDEKIQPVSPDLQNSYKQLIGAAIESEVLVVSGGGLGARDINDLTINIVPALLDEFPKLRIFHITGNKHENQVKRSYASTLKVVQSKRVSVMGFTTSFYKYTGAADLVVSRAGATTIAELSLQGKPTILIPAPFLTGGHQLKNAESLARKNAVEVADNDIKPLEMYELVKLLLKDKKRRQDMSKRFSAVARPDAADVLAQLILKVASSRVDT